MKRFAVRLRDRYWIWVAAVFVLANGLVVLLGWALDIAAFKSVVPGAVELKPNTAIAMCFTGLALGLLAAEVRRVGVWFVNGAAGLVSLLGVLTLIEYVTGTPLGIDELLVRDTAVASGAAPGRMSPYAAYAFSWLGLGLGVLQRRPRHGMAWLCAAQVGMIGAVSLGVYLWNATPLVADTWLPPVALNTAVTLTAVAAAMLGLHRRARARHAAYRAVPQARALTLAFWTLAILLVASTTYTYRSNTRFLEAERQVERLLADAAGPLKTAQQQELARRRGAQELERTSMLVSLLLTLAASVTVIGVMVRIMRSQLNRNLRSREQLKIQRSLLSAVVESSTDAIVYKDADGSYLGCNEAYAAMLGLRPENVVGRRPEDLFEPEQALRIAQDDARTLAAGLHTVEEWVDRPDGTRVLMEVVRSPMRDAEGRATGVLAVGRDITSRKQQEEEVQRARTLAEEATRMKSAFLANMSHEIRTPLNAIIGMGHLALQTDLTRQQRDYLGKLQGAARHLLQVVDEILDMSKIEAGKLKLEDAPFTLRAVLDEVTAVVAHRVREKGLEFSADIATEVPRWLVGDALRVRQVLLNYINNAVKFTDRGRIGVQVELMDGDGQEALLKFSVRDTGIGLSEDEKARLFQDFQQADSSTTRKYGGTGLGLSISRSLAQLMGGEAGVQSEARVGSTFWFTGRFGVLQAAPDAAVSNMAALPDQALAGIEVLLVEDNEINQQVAREILESEGARVTIAENGEVALRHAAEREFDLALMDMHMPVMDGVQATRELRRLGYGMPIVAMTASAMAADRERCLDAGMNDFATKPIDPSQLVRVVRDMVPTGVRTARQTAAVPASAVGLAQAPGGALKHAVTGLDWEDGLSHIPGNDVPFFLMMLGMFLANHEPTMGKLHAALAGAKYDDVKIIAHTLKGTAATLGARDLSHLAGQLEQACDDARPREDVEVLAGRLASKLTDLRTGLASALPGR